LLEASHRYDVNAIKISFSSFSFCSLYNQVFVSEKAAIDHAKNVHGAYISVLYRLLEME
jgi:hypothetical protein